MKNPHFGESEHETLPGKKQKGREGNGRGWKGGREKREQKNRGGIEKTGKDGKKR